MLGTPISEKSIMNVTGIGRVGSSIGQIAQWGPGWRRRRRGGRCLPAAATTGLHFRPESIQGVSTSPAANCEKARRTAWRTDGVRAQTRVRSRGYAVVEAGGKELRRALCVTSRVTTCCRARQHIFAFAISVSCMQVNRHTQQPTGRDAPPEPCSANLGPCSPSLTWKGAGRAYTTLEGEGPSVRLMRSSNSTGANLPAVQR